MILVGVAVIAAGVAAQAALTDGPFTARAAIAAALALLLGWAFARRRTAGHEVYLEEGTVHVVSRQSHVRFDLANPNVRLEVMGEPHEREWKVLFLRRSLPPFVVDRKLVDPQAFTDAVREWRPDA